MSDFDFISVNTIDEALDVLARPQKVTVLSGGTDVMLRIHDGRLEPSLLLDVSRIEELKGIKEKDGFIEIGAATTINEIGASELIKDNAYALYEAADVFADPNTRNRATIGGNITNASPGADGAPALFALDGEVLIKKKGGERRIPVTDYIIGSYKTVLEPDELVASIRFKPCKNSAFIKIGLRKAMAISVETVAVALFLDENKIITDCRVAFGALGPSTLRARNTEKVFVGYTPNEETFAKAQEVIAMDIKPRDGLRGSREYRFSTAHVIMERALIKAYEK
ncbi:MAG: xanthine dehydrogenase family protein subunit M [Lachnospiraceae bacterium]|jgi:carbon-monoxide dehydrogenase medium subunit|nr:xanthine dehydrogenase family protein subunit M [Lachnospiraceae bacterium]